MYIDRLDPNNGRNMARERLWEQMEAELGREPSTAEFDQKVEELDWEHRIRQGY